MVWLKLLAVTVAAVLLVWMAPFLWEIGVAAVLGAAFWLFTRPDPEARKSPPEQGEA
ncbi:MAG TPA: hypothetical protein VJ548_09105 [Azospira sp.]|nr:hypothetical protein [Azospira sp.]